MFYFFNLIENYVPEFWFVLLLAFLLLLWVSGGYLIGKISRKDNKLDTIAKKKERKLIWLIVGLFVFFIFMLYIAIMPFITLGIIFSK